MAKLIPYPKFKSFKSDGTVNASGNVYTYITGTTTNKATYTDSTEGTPNANPVVLDSSGEANIWGLTDQAYTLKITDSAGTTIDTIDEVPTLGNISTLESNLDVNGNSIISTGANNITITPNGSGVVVLDGLTWPSADGTNGQVIQTNGSSVLSFVANGADVVNDTTPQLGGDVDCNTFSIAFDTGTGIKDENGNEQLLFTTVASAVNSLNITNAATNTNVILEAKGDDTSIGITITPKGTGAVVLDGLTIPTSDGTANDVVITDGAGTLSFGTSGKFVQRKTATSSARVACTTVFPVDNTIAQSTEGDEVITVAITPTSASNRLLINFSVSSVGVSIAINVGVGLFQDATAGALACGGRYYGADYATGWELVHEMAAGTTSSTTFKIRMGPASAATIEALGDGSLNDVFGGAGIITLTVEEYES